jgi:hypothetical protein
MKFTTLTHLAPCLAAAAVTLAAASASGQDLGNPVFGDESLQEPFLQDRIVDYQGLGEIVSPPPSENGSYVGDIPIEVSGAPCGSADGAPCGSADGGASGGAGGGASGGAEGGASGGAGGMIQGRSYGQPDLFYNYYTQGYSNQANAQMYLSPLPIPPNVGHTFYTYQPFYPHHMMYWHKDRFHRSYDNGRGMNRTKAVYYSPPIRQAMCNLYWNYLRLPR